MIINTIEITNELQNIIEKEKSIAKKVIDLCIKSIDLDTKENNVINKESKEFLKNFLNKEVKRDILNIDFDNCDNSVLKSTNANYLVISNSFEDYYIKSILELQNLSYDNDVLAYSLDKGKEILFFIDGYLILIKHIEKLQKSFYDVKVYLIEKGIEEELKSVIIGF